VHRPAQLAQRLKRRQRGVKTDRDGSLCTGLPHVGQEFKLRIAGATAKMRPHALGHVWTALWQELSDALQHWSGAVTCPAAKGQ
jgi:hypothetical protein